MIQRLRLYDLRSKIFSASATSFFSVMKFNVIPFRLFKSCACSNLAIRVVASFKNATLYFPIDRFMPKIFTFKLISPFFKHYNLLFWNSKQHIMEEG